MDNELFAGLRVNGGYGPPLTNINDPKAPLERELYLDINSGYLYSRYNGRVDKIKSGFSDSTNSSTSVDSIWGANYTKTQINKNGTVQLGGFSVTSNDQSESNPTILSSLKLDGGKRLNVGDNDSYTLFNTIKYINFHHVGRMVLKNSAEIYGKELPKIGVEGQIFFKIV